MSKLKSKELKLCIWLETDVKKVVCQYDTWYLLSL